MRLNLDMNPTKKMETNFSLSYTQQDINSPVGAYSDGGVAQNLRLLNRISETRLPGLRTAVSKT